MKLMGPSHITDVKQIFFLSDIRKIQFRLERWRWGRWGCQWQMDIWL